MANETAKSGATSAILLAGVLLAAADVAHGLARRWELPPGYLAFVSVLSIAFALVIALLVRRLPSALGLALWAGAAAALCGGWTTGALVIAAGIAAGALVDRAPWAARARGEPAIAGAGAALGVWLATVTAPGLASTLGLEGLPFELGPAVIGALLFGLATLGGPLALGLLARLPALVGAGVAALLLLALAAEPVRHAPSGTHRLPPAGHALTAAGAASARPHVILLVLDTVRADHLSLYGYERETTPELARWVERRDGVVVQHAYANGTWTVPSHASLFTGRLPHEHGAHFALDGSVRWRFGLNPDVPTLAEVLQGSGYATLGTFANNWLRVVEGMGRGFERYFRSHHTQPSTGVGEVLRRMLVPGLYLHVEKRGSRARTVNETLLSMAEPWSRGPQPLYLFANYGDAHGPYAPPPPFRGRFRPAGARERARHLALDLADDELARLEARYDEEIAYLDAQLGRLLTRLERLGLLDEAWVFITSDHGEAFGEHGVTEHGTTVHDEVVRIPLIILPPGTEHFAPVHGPVSLVDVAATIAGIAGAELPGPGRDLRGGGRPRGEAKLEFYGDAPKARRHGELSARPARVVVAWPYKLIERGDRAQLFDLVADPGETRDLAPDEPARVEALRARLTPWGAPTLEGGAGSAGANELFEQLRALGYVDDE